VSEEYDAFDDECEPDVCHHMVGFDESCEWCDLEDWEERRAKALARKAAAQPQQELPL
jgi:hypothetical protein